MIYPPHALLDAIQRGEIIQNLSERELNEPEGVGFDLRVASLSEITNGSGSLLRETRRTPDSTQLELNSNELFILRPGKTYLATTLEEFSLPIHLSAIFFPRSTLFRSGILFQSSILPPGYSGPMTFALTNTHYTDFEIQFGARFAHVVIMAVDGQVDPYRGQWNEGRISQPDDEKQI